MIFMLLAFSACGEKGDEFGSPDQLLLLSDREIVCAGQTATLRIFSTQKRSEIPISEFDFDPLPTGIESISSNGLLNVGTITASSEVTISGTYKGKTKLSTKLKIQPASTLVQPSLVVSPFGFFNKDGGAPHYFWPDGSVILGSEIYGPESLKKFEIKKYSGQGVLEWKKDLGSGEAKFIQVQNDKIYAAGKLNEIGGAVVFLITRWDGMGNLIWEKKIPVTAQHVFSAFQVDDSGNFYLSSFTNGNSFITRLAKYDIQGEMVWEVDPKTGYKNIFTFPNGHVAAYSEEGLGLEPFLTFFNEEGSVFKKERTEFGGKIFLGPNQTVGVGYPGSGNESFSILFDLYDSKGLKVVARNALVRDQSFSGILKDPVEKKYAPSFLSVFFSTQSGEILVLDAGFWGDYDFYALNSSDGQNWLWWQRKSAKDEGIYPLKIAEEGDQLILFAQSDGKLYRFSLGKDYSFDDCLRESFWNKLEMF